MDREQCQLDIFAMVQVTDVHLPCTRIAGVRAGQVHVGKVYHAGTHALLRRIVEPDEPRPTLCLRFAEALNCDTAVEWWSEDVDRY